MSSEPYYRKPREWVKIVIKHLEHKMGIKIESIYKRVANELTDVTFTYQVGESDPFNHLSNEERSQHRIELRIMIEVPTSVDEFDLEALDASCRIEREICNQFFSDDFNHEDAELVSNLPSKFAPELGVFARTITMRQQIYVGPLED
ncbi:hypothetical protein [Vibrio hepatarius]|uniref:hypothetical protein n=1 Tax=Vibrio hepatarius TaxID=171383 RepID=UPI001C0A560D|nr:hypothetical protein [Vibrio hepatarius]MBU2897688.1 hypothetical protein [Vibrio hepatarius]